MMLARLLIVACALLIITDHKLGDDRVIRSVAAHASDMAYQLNDSISHMLRRLYTG
jgi:hypothetical protein